MNKLDSPLPSQQLPAIKKGLSFFQNFRSTIIMIGVAVLAVSAISISLLQRTTKGPLAPTAPASQPQAASDESTCVRTTKTAIPSCSPNGPIVDVNIELTNFCRLTNTANRPPLNVAFVVDTSASMAPYLANAKTAMSAMLNSMDDTKDRAVVISVTRMGQEQWGLNYDQTDNFFVVRDSISSLTTSSSDDRNTADGFRRANFQLQSNQSRLPGIRSVIINLTHRPPNMMPFFVNCSAAGVLPTETTACTDQAIAEATLSNNAGTYVYNIGLDLTAATMNNQQSTVDLAKAMLKDMSSSDRTYYEIAQSNQLQSTLQSIFSDIISIPATSINGTLKEFFPASVNFIESSASPSAFTRNGQQVNWNIDNFYTHRTKKFSFQVRLPNRDPNQLIEEYPTSGFNFTDLAGVSKFAPLPETRVTPPAVCEQPVPPWTGSSCVEATKIASPLCINSQYLSDITLTLTNHCQGIPTNNRAPIDAMILFDQSMTASRAAQAKTALLNFGQGLDLTYDRIGLEPYLTTGNITRPLQFYPNYNTYQTDINSLNTTTILRGNLDDAIGKAQTHFETNGRANATKVMIIISDKTPLSYSLSPSTVGDCLPPYPSTDNNCTYQAKEAAYFAKRSGILIYSVGLDIETQYQNNSQAAKDFADSFYSAISSSPSTYFNADSTNNLSGTFLTIANALKYTINYTGKITDILPSGISLVPFSTNISPTTQNGQTITWDISSLRTNEVVTRKFQVKLPDNSPNQLVDEYPNSRFEYINYSMQPQTVAFPETRVSPAGITCQIILTPTPSPTRGASPTPGPSSTPRATPTPLPTLASSNCIGVNKTASASCAGETPVADISLEMTNYCQVASTTDREPLDIMLVLDFSGSMYGSTIQLKDAAIGLLNGLDPNKDRAGVVKFNTTATVVSGLTSDFNALESSIINISSPTGSTNMAQAIQVAQDQLIQSSSSAKPILVLFSDGQPTNLTTALTEAQLAKDAGTTIYTVGLGSIARDVLISIASSPNYYFEAPTPEQLQLAFQTLVHTIINNVRISGILTDILPAGINVIPNSFNVSPNSQSGQTMSWSVPEIDTFSTKTISFQVSLPNSSPDQLVDVFPDSAFQYTDPTSVNLTVPFPETKVSPLSCGGTITPTLTPTQTPSSSPTSSPTATVTVPADTCNYIAMNYSGDVSRPLHIGDEVFFECGQVAGAFEYQFQIKLPGETDYTVSLPGGENGISNNSMSYTLPVLGVYDARCRICDAVGVCQNWE